nr:integrase, catalytic region, zinc finger, CCHC-type, peptidase aspartic, catalytic [Tanacetum cinerariifolium]
MVSKDKVKTDKSKPVTSCSTPKNEQGVASSSSVKRPESKDTNLKKRVLLNTKSKSTSKDIVLWIVNIRCSKHMTGNLKSLRNFVEKFTRIIRFGNDHFAAITGYLDYVQGNLIICHVYYVEGLRYNLFSARQFCDEDLEVAFWSTTCFVWNLEDNSTANTLYNEDTPSSSLIIVEEHEAPQLVPSLEEPVSNEPTTLVSDDNADELVQEDVAELDETLS